jgi:amidohydrolase
MPEEIRYNYSNSFCFRGVFMQIIADRRALHRIPELELKLPATMAYLEKGLEKCRCTVFSPMESALCAFFDFGREDAIAFRADCDALPILEKNEKDYISTHPGCMHACGHDGHTAILLELARRLSGKKTLPHNILLIFQPGEESPGGALPICKAGVLETYNVKSIFGLHIWPGLEKGVVFSRENELMSHCSEVNIDIYGKSVHIAKAAEGIDATEAAASILLIQTILNALGTVDVLPLTGVTFPFLSNGGTSMIASWGLLAFVKAADTRQNASFAVRLKKKEG